MVSRPKVTETEEDLLRMQEEFLRKANSKPSATVVRMAKTKENVSNVGRDASQSESHQKQCLTQPAPESSGFIIGAVIEKNRGNASQGTIREPSTKFRSCNFPPVSKLELSESQSDSQRTERKGTKRSIFAMRMASTDQSRSNAGEHKSEIESRVSLDSDVRNEGAKSVKFSEIIDYQEIENENASRIESMTEEEILAEKSALESRLGLDLVEFLKNRKRPTRPKVEMMDRTREGDNDIERDISSAKSEDGQYIWSSDLPPVDKSRLTSESAPLRFDHAGLIVTDFELPVHLGLHHHGQEPEVPGYTLEELFHLSRSSFPQQKCAALRILTLVCHNAKQGCFAALKCNVFQVMVDMDLPLIARYALDESSSSLLCQSVHLMRNMLVSDLQTQHFTLCSSLPFGFDNIFSAPTRTEDEQSPEELVKDDLILGLLKMGVVARFRYILEVVRPPDDSQKYILEILCAMARHSMSAAYDVFKCPRLFQFLCSEYLCFGKPDLTIQFLRLCSYLVKGGLSIARSVSENDAIIKFVLEALLDTSSKDCSSPEFRFGCECHVVVRLLLDYKQGFLMDQLRAAYPILLMKTAHLQLINLSQPVSGALMRHCCLHLNSCSSIMNNLTSSETDVNFGNEMLRAAVLLFNKWSSEMMSSNVQDPDSLLVLCCLISLISDSKQASSLVNVSTIDALAGHLNKNLRGFDFSFVETARYTKLPALPDLYVLFASNGSISTICLTASLLKLCENSLITTQNPAIFDLSHSVLRHYLKFTFPSGSEESSFGFHLISYVLETAHKAIIFLSSGSSEVRIVILKSCLKLSTEVTSLNRNILKDLFINRLFDVDLVEADVNRELSRISVSDSHDGREHVLPRARTLYLACFDSFLQSKPLACLSVNCATAPQLPEDWFFQPVTLLMDRKEAEMDEKATSSVEYCLDYLNLNCTLRGFLSNNVMMTRLMCVFLLPGRPFLEKNVAQNLRMLFLELISRDGLTLPDKMKCLPSFYDHYVRFVEQFEAESFGDVVFSNYLLLPMCTRFNWKYRRAVWIEFIATCKVLRMSKNDLLFPIQWLVEPAETNADVLAAQKCCLEGDILDKCPILQYVAQYNSKL